MCKSKNQLLIYLSVIPFLFTSTLSHSVTNDKELYKKNVIISTQPIYPLRGGLYLGFQGGYDMINLASEIPKNQPFLTNFNNDNVISLNPDVFTDGMIGGIFIGYGKYFNRLYNVYLGLEIFANLSGTQSEFEIFINEPPNPEAATNLYEAKFIARESYGIDLIPGIKVGYASLLYLKVGYARANFSVSESITSYVGSSQTFIDNDINSALIGGLHYGVGFESTFSEGWSARIEYTHTNYDNLEGNDDFATSGSEFFPGDNQVLLSIIYHFDL